MSQSIYQQASASGDLARRGRLVLVIGTALSAMGLVIFLAIPATMDHMGVGSDLSRWVVALAGLITGIVGVFGGIRGALQMGAAAELEQRTPYRRAGAEEGSQ